MLVAGVVDDFWSEVFAEVEPLVVGWLILGAGAVELGGRRGEFRLDQITVVDEDGSGDGLGFEGEEEVVDPLIVGEG